VLAPRPQALLVQQSRAAVASRRAERSAPGPWEAL